MLKKLKIKGFQSHNDTTLNFVEGLNTIIGPTDGGKSSITRAFKWFCANRPQGDSFRNDFLADKEKVEVSVDFHGNTMSRIKGKGINEYQIEGEIYKALRSDVPDEIQSLTGIKEYNIQTQHPNDQYFLLNLSPGQISKELNKVAGLEKMDKALSAINSKVKETNSEKTLITHAIAKLKSELEETEWVNSAAVDIEELSIREGKVKSLTDTYDTLFETLESIDAVDENLTKFKQVNPALKSIKFFEARITMFNALDSKYEKLSTTLLSLEKTQIEINKYIHIDKALKMLLKMIGEHKTEIDKAVARRERIFQNVQALKDCNGKDKVIKGEIIRMEKTLNSELKTCPLCGRKGK